MKPAQVEELLSRLLVEHGLTELGWTWELDAAVRRFGACVPGRRQIRVSRNLAAINSDDETRDTILHEIAHALAFVEHGQDCGHDARWRAIASRIGARPERTVDVSEVSSVAGAYFLIHRDTGEVFRAFHARPPSRDYRGAWVPGRRADTEDSLAVVSARELARIQAGARGGDTQSLVHFDRGTVTTFTERLDAALAGLCEEFGVSVTRGTTRFSTTSLEVGYTFAIGNDQVESGDRAEFAMHARVFDLSADDYGRTFSTPRGRFTLVGLKPRNRKYPVIGLDARGRRYKFPTDVLRLLV